MMAAEKTALVFGGSGFLGRAIVAALAQEGWLVHVVLRDERSVPELKLLGRTGQIVTFKADVSSDAALAPLFGGAQLVVNAIGTLAQKGKQDFQTVHVEIPARLARLAREAGAARFVHVSHLLADKKARLSFLKTKAAGEEAVRTFFADAVIVKPSLMFGPRDRFFTLLALVARFSPVLPLVGKADALFQPVYVGDVARFIALSAQSAQSPGKRYLLCGADVYSMRQLYSLLLEASGFPRKIVLMPLKMALWQARLAELLPKPPTTRTLVRLLQEDHVMPAMLKDWGADGSLGSLGIHPQPLASILAGYCRGL
ncbi:MAG: complex I NDUFA9 subunit family protein [Alphaproteobacteria bacterium]|nr:complex I NDUFA9 subunit family protein [Alphaproteobacteria bacterium]